MLSDTPTGDIVRTFAGFGGNRPLPNGYKGRISNFDVWSSNNTPDSGISTSIWTFGHNMAIGMVTSLNKVEAYSPELLFGDALKGLLVYGVNVINPGALVNMFTTLL